jgi:hypothetical protein
MKSEVEKGISRLQIEMAKVRVHKHYTMVNTTTNRVVAPIFLAEVVGAACSRD